MRLLKHKHGARLEMFMVKLSVKHDNGGETQ